MVDLRGQGQSQVRAGGLPVVATRRPAPCISPGAAEAVAHCGHPWTDSPSMWILGSNAHCLCACATQDLAPLQPLTVPAMADEIIEFVQASSVCCAQRALSRDDHARVSALSVELLTFGARQLPPGGTVLLSTLAVEPSPHLPFNLAGAGA